MLSAKHHIFCWVASITAAAVYYGIVAGLGCSAAILQVPMIPLLVFATYPVVSGPGDGPTWWTPFYFAATGSLMVCVGAIVDKLVVPGASTEQISVGIHTLLAFAVISVLEPIRQNRQDIEPCHITSIFTGPRVEMRMVNKPLRPVSRFLFLAGVSLIEHIYSLLTLIAIFGIIIKTVDVFLARIYDSKVSHGAIWDANMKNPGPYFGRAMLFYFVVGPLADAAETIFYFIHKPLSPMWMPKPRPLVARGEFWNPLGYRIIGSFFMWAPYLGSGYGTTPVHYILLFLEDLRKDAASLAMKWLSG